MAIKPFHLKLKKVSARQQQLLQALMSFLPRTGLRDRFDAAVSEALRKHAGEAVSYQLEAVSEMTHQAFSNQLPSTPVVAALSCVPVDRKAFLQIDNVLAHVLIDRLLGSERDEAPAPRALTETEQGVLQYLILQLLSHVYRLCGKEARVHFRFDRFVAEPREFATMGKGDEIVTVLTLKMNADAHAGFVKVVVPNALVESAFLDVEVPGERREEERVYALDQLKRFGNFRTVMWAEAGRTTLTPQELVQLEREDVILFDETDITMDERSAIAGRATVRVGAGQHGGFVSEVTSDPKTVHCRLTQHYKGEGI